MMEGRCDCTGPPGIAMGCEGAKADYKACFCLCQANLES